MSANDDEMSDFEKRTRALLEESVSRTDGRIRSRLNQARHAALAQLQPARRRPFWRSFTLAPAAGVVATKNVDTGAAGALFGIVVTGTLANPKIYFNDDNTNTVVLLSH